MKASAIYAAAALVAGQAAAVAPWMAGFPMSNSHVGSIKDSQARRLSAQGSGSSGIKAYNLSVPIDHFHNDSSYEPHSDGFYNLRYWLDTTNYKPGGPVIVLHSGEFDSEGRLPYLEHGIVPILTKATGGVGLVMEHRYYGTSFPVNDTTVENFRFLTTEQALADTAYFAQNVQFPGLEKVNLTSPGTPWIIYGGSYAGAFVALTRKVYPDVYWGAISSSGVTMAITDFWAYFEAARLFAPGDCASVTQKVTHVVDTVLFGGDRAKAKELKDMFGLADLQDDEFGSTISNGISGLQGTNWDPEESSAEFGMYCGTITSESMLFSSTAYLRDQVKDLVDEAGYSKESDVLTARMLNYIGFVKNYLKETRSTVCKGKSDLECFSLRYEEERTDLAAGWYRSWRWQTCKQWGYFVTGSGVPQDQLPLISRAIDLNYTTIQCRKSFNITTPPDIDSINKLGGFDFSYPRLAIVDGAQDPWRAASPHAVGTKDRKSTISEPYILIDPGVHHWDEYGPREGSERPGLPPKHVVDVQGQEVDVVKAWLKEWEEVNGEGQAKDEADDGLPSEL